MMRKKHLAPKEDNSERQMVADYFGLELLAVVPTDLPNVYLIRIDGNLSAQKAYKKMCPFGNTSIPNRYDFDQDLMVMWNGTKCQPA